MKKIKWEELQSILMSGLVMDSPPETFTDLFINHNAFDIHHENLGHWTLTNTEVEQEINFVRIVRKLGTDVSVENIYDKNLIGMYFGIGGTTEMELASGLTKMLVPGQWGFYGVPVGSHYMNLAKTEENYNVIGIHFSLESFKKFMGDHFDQLPSFIHDFCEHPQSILEIGDYSPEIKTRLLEINELDYIEKSDRFRLKSLLFELVDLQIKIYKELKVQSAVNDGYTDALVRLKKELTHSPEKNIDLDEFASSVGLTRVSLDRHFKKKYGDTPKQMAIDYKLLKAMELLQSDKEDVNTTADKLGYASVSSFSRAFYKKFGIRPGKVQLNKDINE